MKTNRIALSTTMAAFLGLVFCACGGGGGGGKSEQESTYDYYVNAEIGNDDNSGTNDAPFKTISKALRIALEGESIKVAPGKYDEANGEQFPLEVPAGVSLIGDEPNKGKETKIFGQGVGTTDMKPVTLNPKEGSVIAGFTLKNLDPSLKNPITALLVHDEISLRNNTFRSHTQAEGPGFLVFVGSGSINHTIVGNVMRHNWNAFALVFFQAGFGSRVEFNVIEHNYVGIAFSFDAGADLGGGSAGSVGQNVIAGNTLYDLGISAVLTEIHAENNYWDEVPPTEGPSTGGSEIHRLNSTAKIHTDGAKLVSEFAP